ncbi:bZIP transcription factor, bZIP-1 [Cordyceps fumosorosea ARSEF 2679]|uniref:BZIP transcription factor, bZIP-1 n=1 Tax=Cordyceps fumosorosea (strain ARSEF 2679) TaxID=1081104 RepID=A0A168CE33_CORFA|nr:bZIP transcription factor, bZIP-1 [Cordyceps fumosorosea ARSEF 2679]OAA71271.1 bZIP transcription factor, bZIP-1 [Cordyceps fumosorosea ARSEF 2679]
MSASAQNEFDALLDLSEYDANYQSPSLSPNMSTKPGFASPISDMTPPPVPSTTTQAMNGPSHNYDMYRQQTGFVPGALANTMAVNQTNNTGYQDFGSLDYLTSFSPENDVFDFNTSPSQATLAASELDMDFDASNTNQFFTVNPSSIEQPQQQASANSSPGRLWPGAHTQAAAVAKAQAHQRHMMQQSQSQKARGKAPQATDPIVEQKITQLLNNMRAKPASASGDSQSGSSSMPRTKKSEEDMDEDERLLASEEGKKLSSKERRQLRNKVSARAFRSRRKEYITQLESERDNKEDEVTRLRQSNRALMEENKRLSDLTRMLLSSPSFSNFLDHLSTNSAAIPQAPIKVEAQPEQEQAQIPKDTNPYGNQSQQQIGMAMIPEQSMDYSMLALDGYNFQPTVFVVDTPEIPAPIDAGVLAGKTSNFVESFSEEEKVDAPVIERPVKRETVEPAEAAVVNEEFESDPDYALFHAQPSTPANESSVSSESLSHIDVFGGIEAEKVLSRYELVDVTEVERSSAYAMARVQHIAASAESVMARLELLTREL